MPREQQYEPKITFYKNFFEWKNIPTLVMPIFSQSINFQLKLGVKNPFLDQFFDDRLNRSFKITFRKTEKSKKNSIIGIRCIEIRKQVLWWENTKKNLSKSKFILKFRKNRHHYPDLMTLGASKVSLQFQD